MKHRIKLKITQNRWHNGFLGAGHEGIAILDEISYKESDPLILFIVDNFNFPCGVRMVCPNPYARPGNPNTTSVRELEGLENRKF